MPSCRWRNRVDLKTNSQINLSVVIFIWTCIIGCSDNELREKAFSHANQVIENLGGTKTYEYFPGESFSKEEVEAISLDLRERCDYKNRSGKFVDYFYETKPGHDQVVGG